MTQGSVSYQSDFGYFRNVCLDRSWCVWGSAEMPCALRVRGPISCALGRTDWHLCSFLFSSWISSSRSASRRSKSRILSSFSSRILAKSSSSSLMLKSALNFSKITELPGTRTDRHQSPQPFLDLRHGDMMLRQSPSTGSLFVPQEKSKAGV